MAIRKVVLEGDEILRKQCREVTEVNDRIRMTMEDMGGSADFKMLYERLADHPKALKNEHFKDRIRATIYEHKGQYIPNGNGGYRLNYNVA